MLREIINRKQLQPLSLQEEDSYFPGGPANTGFSRDTASISFKAITLSNFAYMDSETNKLYLNFDPLQQFKQDRINFVSIVGCEINSHKESLIEISEQPLIIINGISYFLLSSQSCNADVLKILYTLCQSVYIHQKLLPDLQNNIGKVADICQAWDIENYLYIVTKRSHEIQSHLKTAAETKSIYQFYDQHEGKKNGKQQFPALVTKTVQNYFSQVYVINQMSISAYDPSIIKQHLQGQYNHENSRWFIYDAILKGCTKFIALPKILPVKQFHKINNQLIVQSFQQKANNNYDILSLEMLRSSTGNASQSVKEKQKEQIQTELMKQRANQKLRIRRLKKSVFQPFASAQLSWLGRTQLFKQKYTQTKMRIQNQIQKLLQASASKNQTIVFNEIQKMVQNDSGLDAVGNSKFDNVRLNFYKYAQKVKSSLQFMVKNILLNKGWNSKNKPIKNNRDLLSNLQTRIQINERKKSGLQQAFRLAMSEQEYLKDFLNIKNNRNFNPIRQ